MSSDPVYLARTKSAGGERRAPPPIKPKPSTLTSPPTADASEVSSPTLTLHQQPSHVTLTANGTPTSSSFGDLRKTFERQQNSSPLFMASASAQGTRATPKGGVVLGASRGSTSTGQLNHHASISHVSSGGNNTSQLAPSFGYSNSNSNSNNRPRSVSSPGPPLRDTDDDADGIDNSQPDFGNLRARFQSQMSLSGQGAPKPDTPRPKPKPAVGAKPTFQTTNSLSSTLPSSRMSMDSVFNNNSSTPSVPRSVSAHPTSIAGSTVVSSRLSSNSFKQPPRPPPPMKTHSPAPKTPTPPRTPPRVETPESERNPFMGSDEDEAGASRSATAPPASSRSNSSANRLSNSKIQQNPVFQQLNNQAIRQPMAAVSGRDSVLVGKAAPPPPQRAAPRPNSPQGLPPKLPSRANSAVLVAQDTPEEKERKHRLDKRRRVVQELLETEISFSKDMLLLQEVYVTDMSESPLFTQADVKIVFTNLADVVALTLDFIAFLTPACGGGIDEEYDDSTTFVGEAFSQTISRIRRVYSEYCKRQEASAQHLQDLDNRRDLKPFFDACTEKCKGRTTGWDLASLLIKPVQRVLKYPLLINQIHALTPSDHQDFESLVNVQKEMLQVAEEINELKKRKDIVEKIVGSKKKNDSDIVHGFNKKFARTTQQLRQAVGGSEVTVDILFEALLEKFNMQQRLVREFAKYIQSWLVSIKQFFDTQDAFATTLADIYGMVPIHRTKENQSLILVHEFHKNLAQFSKTIGRELENRLKKTVYKSIERFLKLFSGPLQVMKKREKKLLDYDNVRDMKDRGETIDKNMLESAAAYTAINEQLVDELPKFLGLTTQYFDIIVMEFSQVQQYFYTQVKARNHDFYTEYVDSACSKDLAAYLEQMDICEDYIKAMTRNDGPLERLNRISLIHDVSATHEAAFQSMRDAVGQRLRRNASRSHQTRSRSSSTASPVPTPTAGKSTPSWQHSPSGSQSSLQSPLQPQPRFYPGEDENPFEVPESIFHDGSSSVTSYDDGYEPFGNSRGGESYDRPLSMASSTYSFGSASTDQQEFRSKPPELDDGMEMDEIGIAQALFECTAIYPYSSTEDRQLNFEAGESIVVFGLNDNGWYFGKKVGKDATGWFPASHCIQI